MSHRKSYTSVERNKSIWTRNLVRFEKSTKRRGDIALEETSLQEKNRIPLKVQIIGRYQFLGVQIKGRKERVAKISEEVSKLWQDKLNFPYVSIQAIRSKIDNVLKSYDECVKRGKYNVLNELFDITKVCGQWLCTEDKVLYQKQLESKGQVGYATDKVASKSSIHPSKRIKLSHESTAVPSSSYSIDVSESSADSEESEYEEDEEDDNFGHKSTRTHHKSKVAANLVTSTRVSINKAAKICKQLSRDGINIPTPSQAAIHKSTFKEAGKVKEEMIKNLQNEKWSLHFDGKHIEDTEYQVVVLKNEKTEVKLAALTLKDSKAATIAEGIVQVIEEYNLWNAVNMIVSDTTSVNTGKKNGVVVKLQKLFADKGISVPQFISCQHHVLDRILRVVMDDVIDCNTKSPNIAYPFVPEVMTRYEELKVQFVNGTDQIVEKSGWRDDMKFLFHLTRVFRFFEENGKFPFVKFQKIPNISNARWNSRAILVILAFILMPALRESLLKVCRFISYDWANYWFTDQMYNKSDFSNLSDILKPYKKALAVLENHWKKEPSMINIPRSNQCAERAIKVMQELYYACKKKDNLQLRFILSNKQ